jgi:hypothetical protein
VTLDHRETLEARDLLLRIGVRAKRLRVPATSATAAAVATSSSPPRNTQHTPSTKTTTTTHHRTMNLLSDLLHAANSAMDYVRANSWHVLLLLVALYVLKRQGNK